MNLGSILTVISILIALASLAYSSSQRIVVYKFCKIHYIVLFLFVVLASYLLMFDKAYANGLYLCYLCYDSDKCLSAEQWAYILTLVFLGMVFYKVFISKDIPKCNTERLICYYENLISSNPVLLMSYLQTYHSEELEKQAKSMNDVENSTDKNKRAGMLYKNIIFNPEFSSQTIGVGHPLYFLECVHSIANSSLCDFKESAQKYYRLLLKRRDCSLWESIINTNNYLDDDEYRNVAYRLDDYRFSELTFGNVNFVLASKIWRSFGEEGIIDASAGALYNSKRSESLEEEYKKSPARICISFYDIFIRQILYNALKNNLVANERFIKECFIDSSYLYSVCEEAISKSNIYKGTYAELLVEDTKSVIYHLLKTCVNAKVLLFVPELLHIVECLITISSLSETNKVDMEKWYMELIMELNLKWDNEKLKSQCLESLNRTGEDRTIIIEGFKKVDTVLYLRYPLYNEIKGIVTMKDKKNNKG